MGNRLKKSLFGKGFITCLIKFVKHEQGFVDSEKQLWLAKEHFEDLELPEIFEKTEVEKLVRKLTESSFGPQCGKEAVNLVERIAMAVDKHLGLKPDIGKCD